MMSEVGNRRVDDVAAAGTFAPRCSGSKVRIRQRHVNLLESGTDLMPAVRLSRPVVRADVGRPEVCAERVIKAEQPQPSASNGGKDRLHVENRHTEALPSYGARLFRSGDGVVRLAPVSASTIGSHAMWRTDSSPCGAHARCSAPVINGVRDSPGDLSGVGLDDVTVMAVADEFERLA